MRRRFITAVAAMAVGGAGLISRADLTIFPAFSNTDGHTWNTTEENTVNQAISDWLGKLKTTTNQTINVTFDFTNVGTGGYLAQWSGGFSEPAGTNIYPYTPGVTHTIHLNDANLANDSSTTTNGTDYFASAASGNLNSAVPNNLTDALSVFRHEVGHMLGFTNNFYYDNFSTGTQSDKWSRHITVYTANHTAFFDPSGLNVQMASDTNLGHVFDVSVGQQVGNVTYPGGGGPAGDLMSPAIAPGVRRDISTNDLQMLQLAYGYVAAPEPASLGLLGLIGTAFLSRRRRV